MMSGFRALNTRVSRLFVLISPLNPGFVHAPGKQER